MAILLDKAAVLEKEQAPEKGRSGKHPNSKHGGAEINDDFQRVESASFPFIRTH